MRCPLPFDDNKFGTYTACLKFERTVDRTWPQCKTYCESINGTMLNMETKPEFDCVRDYMSRLPSSSDFYYVLPSFKNLFTVDTV